MREPHLRRVVFEPADESDRSLRARARRRVAARSWTRRHSLRWLVPPLVASAIVNAVLLVSAIIQPDEAVTTASSARSTLASGAAKVGTATTSLVEQAPDDGDTPAFVPLISDATTATNDQLVSPATVATAAPSTVTPPPTARPNPVAPTAVPPTTVPPTTVPPTTVPPAALPPAALPPVASPTSAQPTTEPDDADDADDSVDDSDDESDDESDDRQEERRQEREEAREDRREALEDRRDQRSND